MPTRAKKTKKRASPYIEVDGTEYKVAKITEKSIRKIAGEFGIGKYKCKQDGKFVRPGKVKANLPLKIIRQDKAA